MTATPAAFGDPRPLAPFPRWLSMRPLERVAPEWATRTRDLYTVQGQYTRSILIGDAPPSLTPGWLATFLLSAGDATLSLYAVPIPPGEANRALRMRRAQYLTDIQQSLK